MAGSPDLIAELGSITADLATALKAAPDYLIRRLHGEERPEKLEFFYQPPAPQPQQVNDDNEPTPVGPVRHLAANAACTLCDDRTFPLRGFRREGKLPVLVLHYSGPMRKGDSLRDRSNEILFGSPEEDDLFGRMLGALNLAKDDFHYLQYPGCVFNPERSLAEDWNRRCGNCLKHVNETVSQNGIQLLLLLGASAVFLLSEEKARELAVSGGSMPIPLDVGTVPALVLRSPAAVLALERKRRLQADKSKESEEYAAALAEEKQVKQSMLDALKAARAKLV